MSVVPLHRILPTPVASPDVEIVIPVYNEAEQLAASVTELRTYLDTSFPFVTTVTIADNASTDRTWQIATQLAATLDGVEAVHLDKKGRGRALRATWSRSTASVVAYMDVDLATGLDALLPLVAPLISGHSDIAIGSRLSPGSHVVRGARREMISRSYNLLLRSVLRTRCTDAQCGFKAMRREVAAKVIPLVEDDEWFFDTEVLVTARRAGLRIHEVPVDWVDDLDSRVDIFHTAMDDLRGVWRLLGTHRTETDRADQTEVFADELLRFAGVGVLSTAAYAGLFAALEPSLGAYLANTAAIVACSLANTTIHRGMAGPRRHLDRTHRVTTAALLLGVSLAFTTVALAATRALGFSSLAPELCALTAANVAAALIRFGILRTWVFRPQFGTHLSPDTNSSEIPPPAGSSTTLARRQS